MCDAAVMPMGRPASTTSGRLALRIDERLKLRAAVWALKHGMTVSEMVEAALVAYMRSASTVPAKRQGTLPLDERQPEARS